MKTFRRSLPIILCLSFLGFTVGTPDAAAQTDSKVHVVASGETLYGIARQYDLSIAELRSYNGLTGSLIRPGQSLRLGPGPTAPKSTSYVVRAGDTLWSIAKSNGTTVSSLMEVNRLSGSNLAIGQELQLASDGGEKTEFADAEKVDLRSEQGDAATVAEDALAEVKSEVSTDDVAGVDESPVGSSEAEAVETSDQGIEATAETADQLSNNEVAEGRMSGADGATTDAVLSGGGQDDAGSDSPDVVVRIDDSTEGESFDFHRVKDGESWESIARRYGTTVEALVLVNETDQVPSSGSRIRIPADPTVFHYKVEDGDTIERIAKWFTVDAAVIRRLNDLQSDSVTPGDILRIPDLNSPLLRGDQSDDYRAVRQESSRGKSQKESLEDAQTEPKKEPRKESQNSSQQSSQSELSEVAARSDSKAEVGVQIDSQIETESTDVESEANGEVVDQVNGRSTDFAEPEKRSGESEATETAASVAENRSSVRVYPESFKGRLMANGNAYNPRRSTVSHSTIAFGSKVRVTNLSTGRSSFAIVADRPLPGSTQVDLSRALATDLGIENTGETFVAIDLVE